MPWRVSSSQGRYALDAYAASFQTPMPADSRLLTFADATLRFHTGREGPEVTQVRKSPGNNCYQHIGVELGWRAPDADDAMSSVCGMAWSTCSGTSRSTPPCSS